MEFGSMRPNIDWLRFVGPAEKLPVVREFLLRLFNGESRDAKPRYFYCSAESIGPGVLVMWDSPLAPGRDPHMCVDMSGSTLATLNLNQRLEVMRALLAEGFRTTRVDVCVDVFGRPGLIHHAIQSCRMGHLVYARRWSPVEEWEGFRLVGHGLNIGRRGSLGSGRFVRLYDKGLERRAKTDGEEEFEPGVWLRWELESSGGCAEQIGALFGCPESMKADPQRVLLEVAFGAVDFRLDPDEAHIVRRDRAQWWADLLGEMDTIKVVESRTERPNLDRWSAYFRRSVGRTLAQMASVNPDGLAGVWRELASLRDLSQWESDHLRPVVWEYMQWIKQREAAAEPPCGNTGGRLTSPPIISAGNSIWGEL
jgi:hypothetical protein